MSSLLRLPHLFNSNRSSSSSGRSRRSSRSGSILEGQGYVQFHGDNSISSVDLVPVTYNVQIPSLSCRRKGTFYVYDKHRKLNIRVKRPENSSPGEVIQVTAYVPATTTSNSGRGSDDSSYSLGLTATSDSSIEPLFDDGEGGEEEEIVAATNGEDEMGRPSTPGERNSIIVLYADPLVCRLDGESSMRAINGPTPNFERERQLLIQSISESKRNVKLSFDVATTCRFQKAIASRCGCLHFSGHGVDGYLFLEDGRGGAHVLRPDQVQVLFNELPFKLVFVSACHSRQIGEAFVDARVPHVICHKQELQDKAALSFTNVFYHALALGHTVNYAFRNGKEEVARHFSELEAEKFLLLPENGDHDEQIFDAEELDEEIEVHSSKNQFIPELPKHFLGRRRDAYELIQKILHNRIVKLVGRDNGVGCSSLAKYVCRYIKDRKTIFLDIQSIYYLRKGYAVDTCIRQLHEQLAAEGKVEEVSAGDETSQDILLNNTLNALREAKALIVFDDVDDENLIERLSERTNTVKILQVTTSLMEVSHHSVGPLDFESSMQLFGKHCQHARNFEALYEKLNLDSTYFTTDIRGRIYRTLEQGIPSQIIRDARGISQEDYQSLFFDP